MLNGISQVTAKVKYTFWVNSYDAIGKFVQHRGSRLERMKMR